MWKFICEVPKEYTNIFKNSADAILADLDVLDDFKDPNFLNGPESKIDEVYLKLYGNQIVDNGDESDDEPLNLPTVICVDDDDNSDIVLRLPDNPIQQNQQISINKVTSSHDSNKTVPNTSKSTENVSNNNIINNVDKNVDCQIEKKVEPDIYTIDICSDTDEDEDEIPNISQKQEHSKDNDDIEEIKKICEEIVTKIEESVDIDSKGDTHSISSKEITVSQNLENIVEDISQKHEEHTVNKDSEEIQEICEEILTRVEKNVDVYNNEENTHSISLKNEEIIVSKNVENSTEETPKEVEINETNETKIEKIVEDTKTEETDTIIEENKEIENSDLNNVIQNEDDSMSIRSDIDIFEDCETTPEINEEIVEELKTEDESCEIKEDIETIKEILEEMVTFCEVQEICEQIVTSVEKSVDLDNKKDIVSVSLKNDEEINILQNLTNPEDILKETPKNEVEISEDQHDNMEIEETIEDNIKIEETEQIAPENKEAIENLVTENLEESWIDLEKFHAYRSFSAGYEYEKLFSMPDDMTILYPPKGRFKIGINKTAIGCLKFKRPLNDVIMEFYLKYIFNNLHIEKQSKVFVFSTFFYEFISKFGDFPEKSHQRLNTWTKKVNIFEKDFIFVPIHLGNHWFLAIICYPGYVLEMSDKVPMIMIFNSIKVKTHYYDKIVARLLNYLTYEYTIKMKKKIIFNEENIRKIIPEVPQQDAKSSDCGLYVLQYVEQFLTSPFAVYNSPMSSLKSWFDEKIVSDKRKDIMRLLYYICSISPNKDVPCEHKETCEPKTSNKIPDEIKVMKEPVTWETLEKKESDILKQLFPNDCSINNAATNAEPNMEAVPDFISEIDVVEEIIVENTKEPTETNVNDVLKTGKNITERLEVENSVEPAENNIKIYLKIVEDCIQSLETTNLNLDATQKNEEIVEHKDIKKIIVNPENVSVNKRKQSRRKPRKLKTIEDPTQTNQEIETDKLHNIETNEKTLDTVPNTAEINKKTTSRVTIPNKKDVKPKKTQADQEQNKSKPTKKQQRKGKIQVTKRVTQQSNEAQEQNVDVEEQLHPTLILYEEIESKGDKAKTNQEQDTNKISQKNEQERSSANIKVRQDEKVSLDEGCIKRKREVKRKLDIKEKDTPVISSEFEVRQDETRVALDTASCLKPKKEIKRKLDIKEKDTSVVSSEFEVKQDEAKVALDTAGCVKQKKEVKSKINIQEEDTPTVSLELEAQQDEAKVALDTVRCMKQKKEIKRKFNVREKDTSVDFSEFEVQQEEAKVALDAASCIKLENITSISSEFEVHQEKTVALDTVSCIKREKEVKRKIGIKEKDISLISSEFEVQQRETVALDTASCVEFKKEVKRKVGVEEKDVSSISSEFIGQQEKNVTFGSKRKKVVKRKLDMEEPSVSSEFEPRQIEKVPLDLESCTKQRKQDKSNVDVEEKDVFQQKELYVSLERMSSDSEQSEINDSPVTINDWRQPAKIRRKSLFSECQNPYKESDVVKKLNERLYKSKKDEEVSSSDDVVVPNNLDLIVEAIEGREEPSSTVETEGVNNKRKADFVDEIKENKVQKVDEELGKVWYPIYKFRGIQDIPLPGGYDVENIPLPKGSPKNTRLSNFDQFLKPSEPKPSEFKIDTLGTFLAPGNNSVVLFPKPPQKVTAQKIPPKIDDIFKEFMTTNHANNEVEVSPKKQDTFVENMQPIGEVDTDMFDADLQPVAFAPEMQEGEFSGGAKDVVMGGSPKPPAQAPVVPKEEKKTEEQDTKTDKLSEGFIESVLALDLDTILETTVDKEPSLQEDKEPLPEAPSPKVIVESLGWMDVLNVGQLPTDLFEYQQATPQQITKPEKDIPSMWPKTSMYGVRNSLKSKVRAPKSTSEGAQKNYWSPTKPVHLRIRRDLQVEPERPKFDFDAVKNAPPLNSFIKVIQKDNPQHYDSSSSDGE